jgi:hypothetical protein
VSDLVHLAYVSAATAEYTDDALLRILRTAREWNEQVGVTGMLVYADGSFMQVLEGPAEEVDALLDRISSDPRHRGVMLLLREPIQTREFGRWTMGFYAPGRRRDVPDQGENDFFRADSSLDEVQEGKAKTLLRSFRRMNPSTASIVAGRR